MLLNLKQQKYAIEEVERIMEESREAQQHQEVHSKIYHELNDLNLGSFYYPITWSDRW
jgi:hypothetical protein